MYDIGNVIYGIPLTEKARDLIDKWEMDNDERWFEDKDGDVSGFTIMYHGGSSGEAGFCGVELGEFNVCGNFRLSDITKLKPTEKQKKQAEEKIKAVPHELRELCPEIDTWVVWSTS